jgi:hypothetical protein
MGELPERSIRVMRDIRPDTTQTLSQQTVPSIKSTSLPPNLIAQTGSGIAYDVITKRIYYNNGLTWLPLAVAGGGAGGVFSYSFIKNLTQTIPSSTPTILTNWTFAPSPPNHDNTGDWNVLTGIFTADAMLTLLIDANITWSGGITNQGMRTIQIVYKPSAGIPIVAKTMNCQGEPDTAIDTAQEASIALEMSLGDQAWVQVIHTAGVSLTISGGNTTSLCGVRINPM